MKNKREHPLEAFLRTLIEAYNLIDISVDLETNNVTDLNKKKSVLYKATIINLCAAWETYIEAVIEDSLSCIIKNAKKSSQIPTNILEKISTRLIAEKDKRKIWEISDDGWKIEVMKNLSLLKEKFNSPRPHNVDEFFYQTIGIKNLSHYWIWKGQSKEKSINKLNRFMNMRGDITHRLTSEKNVYAHIIKDYTNFLYRISTISSNIVRRHTYKLVKVYPWTKEELSTLL